MLVDKVSDYRTQFSKWWISEYKNVQFPEKVDSPAHCAVKLKAVRPVRQQRSLMQRTSMQLEIAAKLP